MNDKSTVHNISYPSKSAAVVFGRHLSAQAVFRLDRNRRSALAKWPAIRPWVQVPKLCQI